jgi:hypothetical protein
MSDDSAKAEEERIQRAMNRKTRASMVVQPSHRSNEPFAPVNTFSQRQPTAAAKPSPTAAEKSFRPLEKPKPTPSVNTTQSAAPAKSTEIDSLQFKKRTILGTIGTTRRELEEVRAEIAKMKNKEAELVSLLEKREQAVNQLNQDIEALELKDHTEDLKRKEDEKARRVKDEIERRRKEEDEEERKKIEQEEYQRNLNPQPIYSPRGGPEEELNEDGLNAEELRIMRAMSRPGKGGAPTAGGRRASSVKGSSNITSRQAMSEEEKKRIAEDNRKKEEESRVAQEKDLQQRIAHLQQPGGIKKTFVSPQIYDFDADVKFIADFTHFQEIPITTPMDNNFTYSVTWQVNPGFHFYLFKINGKTEINKNIPTGLAPNGSLMNKVEC